MSMIKRANGEIETFTDEEGKEVVAQFTEEPPVNPGGTGNTGN